MRQPDGQAASDYRVWRRRLYLMLEPTARQAPGLSITNRCIAGLILLATILTLLETEPLVRALAPSFFITAEAALAMAFLVEYIGRVIAAGEDPRYRGWAGRLRFMASPWAIIDLLAILPFFLTMGAVNAFALRLLKLIRLLRLARLGRFSNAIGDLYRAVRGRRYELTVSLMVAGLLREGNAGPAENADTWIPHLVKRLNESTGAQVRVRIDAGFTDNDTLEALETRDIEYLGRLRSHKGLQTLAAPYLKRPRGRPPEQPREWCYDLEYQAGSWPAPRRVVLVVQERPDDLLLHAFFLVTNLGKIDWPPEKVLALYRKRGSADAHMGEVKSALDVHLSSTDRGVSTV